MRSSLALYWATLSQAIAPALGLPNNPTDDQVGATIDAGTFQKPSVNVRPRFRYWIPDGSADLDTVVNDVKEIARIGASGFEFLGYFLYGGPPAGFGETAFVDWSVYGWGLPAWNKLFKTFAQATKDNGLIMDIPLGPSQGQGVPAPYDDDGKAWDLKVVQTTLNANASFQGTLPGWGTGPLEAVVLAGSEVGSGKTVVASSLKDVTSNVTSNGQLTITAPSGTNMTYILFSVYLIHSDWQAQSSPLKMKGPQTPPQSWIQNGSWSVDHFSARGAQTTIRFFEEYAMGDGIRELIKEVGAYMWEDSIELRQSYRWTKGFLNRFKDQHHYDLKRFLPIMFGYKTDQWDLGERYTMDYRSTLAKGYGEYLREFTKWANEKLGVQYSAQVSYGTSLDELENVPFVNAPEDESLAYANEIDRYRQYAGPANLAGKRIISNELGAEINRAFQQSLPRLLDQFQHAIAGGVNHVVLHGTPYTGNYPNTTWPGLMTFGYQFSECHNRHQPAWEDYSEFMDTMARHQLIFQTGVPKRDVVFWQKRYWYPGNTSYALTDLLDQGYTYEYLSPSNFELPEAQVSNGIFAPNRQGFKVLVVRILDYLTLPGVQRLAEFAKAGLPIIFDGGVPTRMWAYHKCDAQRVSKIMHELATLKNVHVIEGPRNLGNELTALGIEPLTKISSNGKWYTVWREDAKTGIDYVYVYNSDERKTSGTVEFASTKTPYWYDAWTGEQRPVALYEKSDTRIKIPFTLQGNQSAIVALTPKPLDGVLSKHVTSAPESILSVGAANASLSIKAGKAASPLQVQLSDGSSRAVTPSAAEPFTLDSWNLTVEHWDPPADLSDAKTTAVKSNTTHQISAPIAWRLIPGLENVSGRGYYRTTFSWPPAGGADGAVIDFGRVFHTLKLSVNGRKVPPLDVWWAKADIGLYLKEGDNVVEVSVASTLINVMRPIWSQLRYSGTSATKAVPPPQDYGIKAPVVVTPYKETLV